MICKKCKKTIDDDSNFCKYCGTEIFKSVVCPNCGLHKLLKDALYCPDCGSRIPLSTCTVQLQSKVEITNLTTMEKESYTIVPENVGLRRGKMSVNAPLAQALINHKEGDIVEIIVPRGVAKWRIDKVTMD